jgi:nucleoside-diphosphate-sugar epimerase
METGELLVTDLGEAGAVRRLISTTDPELIFDASGYGVAKSERDPRGYVTLNQVVPTEVARATAELDDSAVAVRLGSALEVGPGAHSLDETAPCRPTTEYGRSKLAATLAFDAARDGGAACLTARAFTVFGPGERPGRLVPTLLDATAGDGRIPLSEGSQLRDWTYVDDVVEGLIGLACSDPVAIRSRVEPFDGPCINLASGKLHSVRTFVELFAAEFDIAESRLGFGDVPGLPEEMPHPRVPIGRLKAALAWSPPGSPADGIRRLHYHSIAEVET